MPIPIKSPEEVALVRAAAQELGPVRTPGARLHEVGVDARLLEVQPAHQRVGQDVLHMADPLQVDLASVRRGRGRRICLREGGRGKDEGEEDEARGSC